MSKCIFHVHMSYKVVYKIILENTFKFYKTKINKKIISNKLTCIQGSRSEYMYVCIHIV